MKNLNDISDMRYHQPTDKSDPFCGGSSWPRYNDGHDQTMVGVVYAWIHWRNESR